MPRPPTPLPDELGAVFRTSDARRDGVTQGRLGARDLEAPFRGVRARRRAAEPIDAEPLARDRARRAHILELAHAYAHVAPDHAFFAGRTAAVLHGCPIEHPGEELEVGVLAPHRAPRAHGILGVKVAPHLVRLDRVDGLPVVSAASAWAMLGRTSTVRELIVAGDALVAIPRGPGGRRMPRQQRCTPANLRAATDAGARRGVRHLRAALDHVREGSMSPPETELRLDLVAAGFPMPLLDHEIRDVRGRLLGITELVYPHARLAIEVEGDHHRTSRRQWERDLEKYASYAEAGWQVIRASVAQVRSGRALTLIGASLSHADQR